MSDPKISSKYRQMEHIKHIKELPDTYVGSSILEEKELYVYDNGKIQKKILIGFQHYIKFLMKLL